jgi:hypothetical protein
MADLLKHAQDVLAQMGLEPLEPGHEVSLASRLVHDLGLAGDDFGEFWEEVSKRVPVRELDAGCILSELSRDTYRVTMARSRLGRRFAGVRRHYVSRIWCPAATLASLLPGSDDIPPHNNR